MTNIEKIEELYNQIRNARIDYMNGKINGVQYGKITEKLWDKLEILEYK